MKGPVPPNSLQFFAIESHHGYRHCHKRLADLIKRKRVKTDSFYDVLEDRPQEIRHNRWQKVDVSSPRFVELFICTTSPGKNMKVMTTHEQLKLSLGGIVSIWYWKGLLRAMNKSRILFQKELKEGLFLRWRGLKRHYCYFERNGFEEEK